MLTVGTHVRATDTCDYAPAGSIGVVVKVLSSNRIPDALYMVRYRECACEDPLASYHHEIERV